MDDPMDVDQVPPKDDIDTDRVPKKRKTLSSTCTLEPRKRKKIKTVQISSTCTLEPRKGKKIKTVQISITRKCKLSKLLNVRYKPLKNIFRIIAEIHSVARRDAMNFALLMVCQWIEGGRNDQQWPEVTTEKFWSHCYRAVMPDYNNLNKVKYEDVIINSIDSFNRCRINPETNSLLYQIPPFDRLQGYIANDYNATIVTNVKLHARNSVKSYLRRVLKAFLRDYKEKHSIELQYGKIASTLFDSIVKHGAVSDEVFSVIPGPSDQIKNFYFTVREEYIKTFGSAEYDDLIDFDKVDTHVKGLLYFSGYLLHIADVFNINVRKWTLLPIASHQIVHVKLSGFSMIYHVLAIAFRCGIWIPPQFLKTYDNISYVMKDYNEAEPLYTDKLQKEMIWEELFNLDTLQKKRFRHSVNNYKAKYELDYGIKTDGHIVSVLFKKKAYERIPASREDLKLLPTQIDLSDWRRGLYKLNKEPTGFSHSDRVVGIDPGYRDLIHAVTSNYGMDNKTTRKASSFSVSNGEYQQRAGTFWHRHQELESRKKANIQGEYDKISSPKSTKVCDILEYIRSISLTHERIFNFNKKFHHREYKGYLYSNKKIAMNYVADLITCKANRDTPIQLAHKTNKKSRRQERQAARGTKHTSVPDGVRTVVAYGDFAGSGFRKGHACVPTKEFQRVLASKALVILVDEYRTSITCNKCHGYAENYYIRSKYGCSHKKIKLKKPESTHPNGKKKVRKKWLNCTNDEGEPLGKHKACPNRVFKQCNKLVYPLKQCKLCSVDGKPLFLNRDLNAALNIRSILIDYIKNGYDISSRPAALRRAQKVQDA